MLFNSIAFLVFLPTVWMFYHTARGPSARALILLCASYVFYMWWCVDFVVLLLASTLTDYTCGRLIPRCSSTSGRRMLLGVSVVINLALLGTFKYWNFVASEIMGIAERAGGHVELPLLDWVLPLGISFYTFQTMAYTFDVYREKISPEPNLVRFALYVSFFPQLVAGPIERPARLLPQIRATRDTDSDMLVSGLRLMLWGMFKKVVVADRLAVYVDIVYGDPTAHQGAQLMLATALFAMQIYCDFSGYSDIAIGCARTLGFDLMTNFRRPYLAWCPTEFWRRWHISLSTWFRDYVYVPLGGSRQSTGWAVAALMLTFLVSGFWHGANWTFVAWGALHGALVLVERVIRRLLGVGAKAPCDGVSIRILCMVVTIACVTLAWVFFRASSVSSAVYIITHMFSGLSIQGITCGLPRDEIVILMALVGVVLCYDVWEEWRVRRGNRSLWDEVPGLVRWVGYWSVATCTLTLGQLSGPNQFIYFQF